MGRVLRSSGSKAHTSLTRRRTQPPRYSNAYKIRQRITHLRMSRMYLGRSNFNMLILDHNAVYSRFLKCRGFTSEQIHVVECDDSQYEIQNKAGVATVTHARVGDVIVSLPWIPEMDSVWLDYMTTLIGSETSDIRPIVDINALLGRMEHVKKPKFTLTITVCKRYNDRSGPTDVDPTELTIGVILCLIERSEYGVECLETYSYKSMITLHMNLCHEYGYTIPWVAKHLSNLPTWYWGKVNEYLDRMYPA